MTRNAGCAGCSSSYNALVSTEVAGAAGLCLGCGYRLRDLERNRCPECGRPFDPNDPWTMNMGERAPHLLRTLIGPMDNRLPKMVTGASFCILYGAAWFPIGGWLEVGGWIVLIAGTLYGIVRRAIRAVLRRNFQLPPLSMPNSERYWRWQQIVVALAISSTIYWWPLRLNMWLQRPLLDRFAR